MYIFLDRVLYSTVNRQQYRVNVTFIIRTGKPKNHVPCFTEISALVQWSGTKVTMSLRDTCIYHKTIKHINKTTLKPYWHISDEERPFIIPDSIYQEQPDRYPAMW